MGQEFSEPGWIEHNNIYEEYCGQGQEEYEQIDRQDHHRKDDSRCQVHLFLP